MLVNGNEIFKTVENQKKAVPGFNVFGYEDAKAVIEAAESLNAPVFLMSNKDAVNFTDVKFSAALFRAMAKEASVPVCVHLDHARTTEEVLNAMEAGYTSVMYDGSSLPLEDNIKNTKEIVDLAKKLDISVEAEIGSVAYSDKNSQVKTVYTDPEEAKIFAETTGIDSMAVSIGTLHRMTEQNAEIQYDRLEAIEALTKTPLVIHGSTGVKDEDLQKMLQYNIGKFNIGTALRMAFGKALTSEVINNPEEFDRLNLFKKPMEAVKQEAINKFKQLGW